MKAEILVCCLLHAYAHGWDVTVKKSPRGPNPCLTGYMTEVQTWVDAEGKLTVGFNAGHALDLSAVPDVANVLRKEITSIKGDRVIKALSLSRCGLISVPMIFHLRDSRGRLLAGTLENVTFYGNPLTGYKIIKNDTSGPSNEYLNKAKEEEIGLDKKPTGAGSSEWAAGFRRVVFPKLRELDLRRCSIQVLDDTLFEGMGKLEALYLGENKISYIFSNAFLGLGNLRHLDLSRNFDNESRDVMFMGSNALYGLPSLVSLDFSFSRLDMSWSNAFQRFRELKRLSICNTSMSSDWKDNTSSKDVLFSNDSHVFWLENVISCIFNQLRAGIFKNTSIAYLDVSGNSGILEEYGALAGLEDSLQVLYAANIDLKTLDVFLDLKNLEILNVKNNEIVNISPRSTASFRKLLILDLDCNRVSTWWHESLISKARNLKLLSIRDNNLNMISREMMTDLSNITYLALSGNSIVCNCYSRELFEIAYNNEDRTDEEHILKTRSKNKKGGFLSHTGFEDYNSILRSRRKVTKECEKKKYCNFKEHEIEYDGNYVLIDFEPDAYRCMLAEGVMSTLLYLPTCKYVPRSEDLKDPFKGGWEKLWALILIPLIIFPTLIFLFVFRKNLRYFCVMVKNTATLSLINNSEVINDGTIFHYDVFVSYCNEDRNWVLDHLLPHLEQDCNVSVCLHERDFQVGLSILENIVSCMDRSKSIMLVLSRRFLLSQWCQFEMHLAQHRLLETRREDLILILLEDIPRRIRPTTLHYLMLTKTYIVWPVDQPARAEFWRRLKKSLLTRKLAGTENVSLA